MGHHLVEIFRQWGAVRSYLEFPNHRIAGNFGHEMGGTTRYNQYIWDYNDTVYPLVICYSQLLNMAIELVEFPMKNGDFPLVM